MAANLGVYFHTALGCKGTYTTDTSPAEIGKGQDWTTVSTAGLDSADSLLPDLADGLDDVRSRQMVEVIISRRQEQME
jgi:hypothetical protein